SHLQNTSENVSQTEPRPCNWADDEIMLDKIEPTAIQKGYSDIMLPPDSLWKADVLHLPCDLNSIYKDTLEKLNLLDEALGFTGNQGGHGGITEHDTHKHFACLYSNSAARVQFVLLDPHGAFGAIPHDLLLTLSSHRISLL